MTRNSRRRSRGGPGIVTIYWRDIPSQVTATSEDGAAEKALLEPRFQHAIDRAAAVAGLTDTNDYIEQWRRVPGAVDGDPVNAAQRLATEIDAAYPRDRLEALVAAGGLDPQPDGGQPQ